jgi:large subunit ribosomal protein L17
MKDRQGGYTRIMRIGRRASDSSEMAILEWVNYVPKAPAPKKEKKGESKPSAAGPDAAAGETPKKKATRAKKETAPAK